MVVYVNFLLKIMRYYEKYFFIKVEGNKIFKNNFGEFFLYIVRIYIDKVFG